MQVVGADGRTWTVRRRWIPRWQGRGWERVRRKQRVRQRREERKALEPDRRSRWWDWIDIPLDLDAWWLILAVIVLVVLFIWGVPLLLALADVVLVLLAAAVGVVSRVVFRRPWIVEASSGEERHERPVVGWFASRQAIERLAGDIRAGLPFVPTDAT